MTKKLHSLLMIISIFNGFLIYAQTTTTLPAYESFPFTIGSNLIEASTNQGQGNWYSFNGSTSLVQIVESPSWSVTPNIDTPTENALSFGGSGIDPEFVFEELTGDFGTIYASFLVQLDDISGVTSAFYRIFGFTGDPNSGGTALVGAAHIYVRGVVDGSGTTTGVEFGIHHNSSGSSSLTTIEWTGVTYAQGDQIFMVLGYENNVDGEIASVWLNPTIGTATPPTPDAVNTLDRDVDINRFVITQHSGANTPDITFDELRVDTSWLGATKPSVLSTEDITQLSSTLIYPNPVNSQGRLFVSNDVIHNKEVLIFNILGKKVFETSTVSKDIILPELISGTYIVHVIENDKKITKKIIVK